MSVYKKSIRSVMALNENRIYVGNLPPGVRTKDVQDVFSKYGKILYVDLKSKRGPPFAFIEFDNIRDAEGAVYGRNGYNFDGYKIRVEFPKGCIRNPTGVRKRRIGISRTSSPPINSQRGRKSNNRVIITGIPASGSWQDLKDHMREAGNVCYADVFKNGTGVVEFIRHEDMRYALKKLDDSRFKTHAGEVGYIRVKEGNFSPRSDRFGRSRSRSFSPVYRRRGSPTYSPMRRGSPTSSPLRRSTSTFCSPVRRSNFS